MKPSLKQAVNDPEAAPAAEKAAQREVTILFADVRGFSAIAATHPPAVVLELLQRCFSRMSEIIGRHQGLIDKFIGDSIMAVFAGEGDARGDAARRAVLCAVEMQIAMDDLNRDLKALAWPEMHLGIGINSGKVVAGVLGAHPYGTYTIIGDEVNVASRIEAFSLRGQVLISEATFQLCKDSVIAGGPMEVYLKGKEAPVRLREVLAVPSLGKSLPRQETRRSARVQVNIPFSYRLVENKMVRSKSDKGAILDLGYHGFLAELNQDLGLHSEIALGVDLPLVGYRANDIYARIVKVKQEGPRTLAGAEFTSLSSESHRNIRRLVQMLIQGTEVEPGARDDEEPDEGPGLPRGTAVVPPRQRRRRSRLAARLTLGVMLAFSVLQYYFISVFAQILSMPNLTVFSAPVRLFG